MSPLRRQKSSRGTPQPAGFDFTLHMRRLCDDTVTRLEELRHVDMARVAVSFCQARKATHHGMYASLTPMRFAGGRTDTFRNGRRCPPEFARPRGPPEQRHPDPEAAPSSAVPKQRSPEI